MKKLFTLFMALSLIAGLNAAPIAALSQKKVVKTEKVEKVQKIEFDATMFQAEIDLIKRLDVKRAEDGGDEGNSGSSDSGSSDSGEGGEESIDTSIPLNITAFKASFLGTIAYNYQGYSMPLWNLEFTTDEADTLTISILYPRYNVLAYNDTLQAGGVLLLHGADSLELSNPESHLLIEYLSEDQSGYTYHVDMRLLAEDGNVYTFNGDLQVDAWDAYFEMYCEEGETEACDYMEVTLIDGPSDPIEDVFTTQLTQDQIKVTLYESYHAFTYSFETEDFEGMAFVYALTQAGEFAPKFFDISYSYLYAGDEEVLLDSVAGSVVDNGDGTFNFDFTFYPHSDGTAYQFTGTCGEAQLPSIQYDADEDLEIFFNAASEADGYDATASYGLYWLTLTNESGAGFEKFEVIIYLESLENGKIPAGDYPINDERDFGTCLSSTGYTQDEEGYWSVMPTAVYFLSTDYYFGDTWFLVDGTVTVSYDAEGNLKIEVNAVNSLGHSVHVVYDSTETGIEQIAANTKAGAVRKAIVNGQVMVVRDGKVFNILGARVK